MKTLISIASVALLLTVGCARNGTNPNIGPALLRFSVATAAGYELSQRTNAVPEVRLAADVICSLANGTNLHPAWIVDDINALGPQSSDAVFIIRAAVNAYTLIWNGTAGTSTNTSEMQPYLQATCDGLNDVLPPRGLSMRNAPPPKVIKGFPQIEFPRK